MTEDILILNIHQFNLSFFSVFFHYLQMFMANISVKCVCYADLSTRDVDFSLSLCVVFQYQLRKASMTEIDAFAFLKGENLGDYITYSAFCEALHQVRFLAITACKIKQFCGKVKVRKEDK